MLAISPQLSSTFGWLLEDPMICHQQEKNYNFFTDQKSENSEGSNNNNLHHFPIQDHNKNGEFSNFQDESHKGFADKMVKKLNHNASERDRRKKINTMYSTLRALLPPEDQSRKLSIPATVTRVLKYIPELQKEVERLIQKKDNLLSKKNTTLQQDSTIDFRKQKSRKYPMQSALSQVIMSATRINDQEIIFQISMEKMEKGSFSEALTSLEQEGFHVLTASCFQSFEGRVFYNLHLQGQGCQIMDVAMLKEKLLSFYENGKN